MTWTWRIAQPFRAKLWCSIAHGRYRRIKHVEPYPCVHVRCLVCRTEWSEVPPR